MIFLKETPCYGRNYVQNFVGHTIIICYQPITDSVSISLRIIFMAMFFPGHQVQCKDSKTKQQTSITNPLRRALNEGEK